VAEVALDDVQWDTCVERACGLGVTESVGAREGDQGAGCVAGALAYVHVACTEYLTLRHVGGRSSDDFDAGGVLPEFTGTLMRDGYYGYAHLPAIHAWCAAHLLRDLPGGIRRRPSPTARSGRWRWSTRCWKPTRPRTTPAPSAP
jgi:hypothetical protein